MTRAFGPSFSLGVRDNPIVAAKEDLGIGFQVLSGAAEIVASSVLRTKHSKEYE